MKRSPQNLSRRELLVGGLAMSTVAGFAQPDPEDEAPKPKTKAPEELKVAFIGCGARGRALCHRIIKAEIGIQIVAFADPWFYSRRYVQRYAQKFGFETQAYEDYRELLAQETDLDAVIVATPDNWHAPVTTAALKAGLHVYCEAPMAHTIEAATEMLRAKKESGKLLQIGHAWRSHPTYRHLHTLVQKQNLFGAISHMSGSSSMEMDRPHGWPKKYTMEEKDLEKWGYASMSAFRNWRWRTGHGVGLPFQSATRDLDVLCWMFGARPGRILASGAKTLPDDFGFEHPDTLDAILEFGPGQRGTVHFDCLNRLPARHTITGTVADVEIIQPVDEAWSGLDPARISVRQYRRHVKDKKEMLWSHVEEENLLTFQGFIPNEASYSILASRWTLPENHLARALEDAGTFHMQNFFQAIREGSDLTCPAEEGYNTMVTIKKVIEAINTGGPVKLSEDDFKG